MINGIRLYNELEQYREKNNLAIAELRRQTGMNKGEWYRLKKGKPVTSAKVLANIYKAIFVNHWGQDHHKLRIGQRYIRVNHERLLHSRDCKEMVFRLFQENPKTETLDELAIAFETDAQTIATFVNEYWFTKDEIISI